jgi:hypothetical protein
MAMAATVAVLDTPPVAFRGWLAKQHLHLHETPAATEGRSLKWMDSE